MNALVSYASDSDSDSDSGDLRHTTTTTAAAAAQKTAPLTAESTPTATTASSSAAPSKHHTPEGTPGTRTPDLQEGTDTQQEIREVHGQQEEQQGGEEEDDDDDFVSAALKDLQSFAATVDDSTTTLQQDADTAMTETAPLVVDSSLSTDTAIAAVSGIQPSQDSDQPESTDMDVDQTDTAIATATATTATTVPTQPPTPIELTTEQQIIFDTFLQEINAIPLLPLPSTNQPPLPPLPPRASSTTNSVSQPSTSTTSHDDDHWIQTQTPQTIYSRIHQLSTLPQTNRFNPKEVENRLIEFAIRLLDWEQGGLKPVYFLGEERATREQESRRREEEMSGESDIDDEGDEGELQAGSLPRYSGVVGEMIEFMHTIEKIAPPDDHWTIFWSLKELNYEFSHPATGTKSKDYPPTELRNRLNPPSITSRAANTTTIS